MECLIKQGYNKRKTNIHIECAFTDFANHSVVGKRNTTCHKYFNVQFHPGLPDIKNILQKYMPLPHQSVTVKTVVPDLPIISFSKPHNLCCILCRAKLCQPHSVIDKPHRPPQSCGKSRYKPCLWLIYSNYITSNTNNNTHKCTPKNYMPLPHQSVTMKTVVPDLPIISFSKPHNLCCILCRAKLCQPHSVIDKPHRPPQSCGKSRYKPCLWLIYSNYITSNTNNNTLKCTQKN